MKHRALATLIVLGSFSAVSCRSDDPATAQQPQAVVQTAGQAAPVPAQGGTQTAEAGDLVCVTYCSPTETGTPVAEIRWVVASQAASSAALRTAAAQQNVEAAVNEDGFERGRFVRLSSVAPQARFAPTAGGGAALPGLGELTVSAVTSSQDGASALRLAAPAAGGQENVVLQVQGLRAGMNYYWRVRAATPDAARVVMCRAPICPADRRNR